MFSYIQYFDLHSSLVRLTNGAAVRLTGRLVSSPGKEQSCELLVDQNDVGEVVVLGECDPEASPPPSKVYLSLSILTRLTQSSILDIPYSKENTNIGVSTRPCTSAYTYT